MGDVGKSRIVGSPPAVALPEDPDAVALDVALLVGVAGAGLLSRGLCAMSCRSPCERLHELADEQVDLAPGSRTCGQWPGALEQ